jgi:hypothetical protein
MKQILFVILIPIIFACKEDKRKTEAQKIISEWAGKEIHLPADARCFYMYKDTVCPESAPKPYRILAYIDSTGCSSCKLKLFTWQQIIEEADSIMPDQVDFQFYFQPKNLKELIFTLKRDGFEYPVHIDTSGSINQLNRFPDKAEYQCFLLDSNNKVLMVGNPAWNPKIWELYKTQIFGKKPTETKELLTAVLPDKTVHDYGTIQMGSKNKAVFTIENTGNHPLVISRTSTSCGCTGVEWDKKPTLPGETTTITVEMTPAETGFFHKTVQVFCNVEKGVISLSVKGETR